MTMYRLAVVLLISISLGAVSIAQEDTADPLRAQLLRIKTLRAERPGDGILAYYQAMTHASLGESEQAIGELRGLLGRRLGLIPPPGLGFDSLWDDADFQAVRARLEAEEVRTPEAPERLRLTDPELIPEGVSFDAQSERFFIGSIAQRKILVVDSTGQSKAFSSPSDKLDAVLGLAVDSARRALYAVSTSGIQENPQGKARNAVMRYDLDRGRLQLRIEIPSALQLNDVAVAADGSLYASDTRGGSVYRLKKGASAFQSVGAAGAFPGANGVAVAPDGTVFVALSTGIARLDPGAEDVTRLSQPDDVVTGGLDGLYWYQGSLIGIQNATNPGRVVRIWLEQGSTRISGMTVLQSHHHRAFDEPTTGVVVGDTIVVIANSHVGRYQPDGSLKDPETLKPTVLLSIPLDP